MYFLLQFFVQNTTGAFSLSVHHSKTRSPLARSSTMLIYYFLSSFSSSWCVLTCQHLPVTRRVHSFFIYKNIVFPAQAEHSFFLTILGWKNYKCLVSGSVSRYIVHALHRFSLQSAREAKMSRQTTLGRFGFEKSISHRNSVMETKVPDLVFFNMSRTIECNHLKL